MTQELFIDTIVSRQPCKKHKRDIGKPCYAMWSARGKLLMGICNARAKLAGFNGKIDPRSLRISPPRR